MPRSSLWSSVCFIVCCSILCFISLSTRLLLWMDELEFLIYHRLHCDDQTSSRTCTNERSAPLPGRGAVIVSCCQGDNAKKIWTTGSGQLLLVVVFDRAKKSPQSEFFLSKGLNDSTFSFTLPFRKEKKEKWKMKTYQLSSANPEQGEMIPEEVLRMEEDSRVLGCEGWRAVVVAIDWGSSPIDLDSLRYEAW